MKKHYLFTLILSIITTTVFAQFTCGDSLYDTRDGQKYATVLIGSDCWFKQNLNYGTMVISDSSGVIHTDVSNNGIPEKYSQENDSTNLAIYGGLYEWSELMNYATTGDGQGLCPVNWHVSTHADWQNLIINAGVNMISSSAGNGANKLKAVGEGFGFGAGTDDVGFSALAGGDRDGFGIFYGITLRSIFWTSTLANPTQAYHFTLWAENDTIERLALGIVTTGFSCRCVQNNTTGINNINSTENNITVYPNPATNEITFIKPSAEKSFITIYDIAGRTISSLPYNESFLQINTLMFKPGVYFYTLTNINESILYKGKFIKE